MAAIILYFRGPMPRGSLALLAVLNLMTLFVDWARGLQPFLFLGCVVEPEGIKLSRFFVALLSPRASNFRGSLLRC